MKVNKTWNGLLTSGSFQRKAKLAFQEEIATEQKELWNASMWGKAEKVRIIISSGMLDVNSVGGFNESTPLCEAASEGRKEVVQLLLHAGAEPNKADKLGQTPLYWAAMLGYIDVVQILLDGGSNPNRAVTRGTTPLHQAAMKGYTDVVTLFLERGAKHNKADNYGNTPLSLALKYRKKATSPIIM